MPTKDGFNPDRRLPLFLADGTARQSIGETWDRTVLSSRVLSARVWVAVAAALVVALLWVGIPARLFADLTASITDVTPSPANKSALLPGPDQSTPTTQHTADLQALLPTANDAPAREEMAAGSELAARRQTENSEAASASLFSQFKAWAAEKDAQAQLEPVQPVQDAPASVQETPAQVVQDGPADITKDQPASHRPMQKRRHVRNLHDARAEARPAPNHGKKVRRTHNSRVAEPPAQEARAQEQVEAAQTPKLPSLLPIFGWSN